MAPKKTKEVQRMSLGDFLSDPKLGGKSKSSWAEEVDEYTAAGSQPLPPTDRPQNAWATSTSDRSYAVRDSGPQRIPDRPPYTAHLGNVSYDATVDSLMDFFAACRVINVRIIEDREQQRPKGFAYAEFEHAEGLKMALSMDGASMEGRPIRVKIADPPRDRDGRNESNRDLSDWTRKGPLPDMPSRNNRPPAEYADRRPSRELADDGKPRDFNNWERKGPLSSGPQQMERQMSRDGSRARNMDLPRSDSIMASKQSPAAWGEGRQEGSRPPRRDLPAERSDRPDRQASAADKDMQWRTSMRPDAPSKSPALSREGSEAPSSPAGHSGPSLALAGHGTRPKLNLQRRTVSEAIDVTSPTSGVEPKGNNNPFGGARPIDTASRERDIEEKRVREKREAEEKVVEDRRLAKEAAAKADAEAAAVAAAVAAASIAAAAAAAADAAAAAKVTAANAAAATSEKAKEDPTLSPDAVLSTKEDADGRPKAAGKIQANEEERLGKSTGPPAPAVAGDQKNLSRGKEPRESRDGAQNAKSRATESGNWRQQSEEQKPPRPIPGGPRRGGGGEGRGRGGPRHDLPRHDAPRQPKVNGSPVRQQPGPAAAGIAEQEAKAPEEDGWTTVPNKRRSQGRAIAS